LVVIDEWGGYFVNGRDLFVLWQVAWQRVV